MNKLLPAVTLLLCPLAQASCPVDSNYLSASYLITETASTTRKDNAASQRLFTLSRRGNTVIHEYHDQQITEYWQLTTNGRLKPTRYFDQYQRGIEYQPEDINGNKGDRNWEIKQQLIPSAQLNTLTRIESHNTDCEQTDHYRSSEDSKHPIQLSWQPALKLIKHYQHQTASSTIKWELQSWHNNQQAINRSFAARSDYQTTDYADIGDNESDPFLLKMINLGFVSHGASGFYNAEGKALEGRHEHH